MNGALQMGINEHNYLKDALYPEKENYRILTEGSPLAIAIIDYKNRYQYLNPKFVEIFGYTLDDIPTVRDWFAKAYPAEAYRREVISYWISDMKDSTVGESQPRSFRVTCKDGTEKIMHFRFVSLEAGIKMVIYEDITARHQMEEPLQYSARKWHTTYDAIGEAVCLLDLEGRILQCNKTMANLLGRPFSEIVGQTYGELVQGTSKLPEFCPLLSMKEPPRRETMLCPVDSRWHEVSVDPILDSEGNVTGAVYIITDITELKRAEESLLAAQRRLQFLVSAIPGAIYTCEPSGDYGVTFISDNVTLQLGYEPQQCVEDANFWANRIHPEDAPRVFADLHSRLFQNGYHTHEYRFLHQDGTYRWMYDQLKLVRGENGKLLEIVGFWIDITERKLAEEKLRRTIQEKDLILDNMSEHLIYQDLEHRILWANRAAAESLGMTPEQMVGCFCYELWHRRYQPCTGCPAEKARKTGQPQEGESTTPDGRIWQIRTNPVRDGDGNIIAIVEISREITLRKRAEVALKKLSRQHELILKSSEEGIYGLDLEGKAIFINPAAAKMLGWETEDLIGKNLHNVLHHTKNDGTPHRAEECALKGIAVEGKALRVDDEIFWKKDGTTFPVEYTAGPICDESGQISGVVMVFRNITRRKRAEEELQQSYDKLRKNLEETATALSSALEKRDPYTAGHQLRVTQLACAIATEAGLEEGQIEGIRMAGILHDIGKISVPAEILSKPGKLTEIEFSLIKTHPQMGYDILKSIEFPWPVAEIMLQHHERMDGTGYPAGLKGEEIILESRVLAVADVVEAMASHRPYRPALGIEVAMEEISKNKGILYDPEVADACMKLFQEKGYTLD